MTTTGDLLGMYLHLARASQLRRRMHVRDRLLVLAAVIAQRGGLGRIASYCRHQILQHNPQHMVHKWDTLAMALEESDFLHLVKQLFRRFPQEKAERMLAELKIEMGQERAAYYSDEEYAAALLCVPTSELQRMFGDGP